MSSFDSAIHGKDWALHCAGMGSFSEGEWVVVHYSILQGDVHDANMRMELEVPHGQGPGAA